MKWKELFNNTKITGIIDKEMPMWCKKYLDKEMKDTPHQVGAMIVHEVLSACKVKNESHKAQSFLTYMQNKLTPDVVSPDAAILGRAVFFEPLHRDKKGEGYQGHNRMPVITLQELKQQAIDAEKLAQQENKAHQSQALNQETKPAFSANTDVSTSKTGTRDVTPDEPKKGSAPPTSSL